MTQRARLNSTDPRYAEWIKSNVVGNGYGKCAEATKAMAEAFPELRRVRGHYLCFAWGRRTHWWLETASGEIVDPTCEQFPSRGTGDYIEFTGKDEDLPTGVCADCREPTFRNQMFCSLRCEKDYVLYIDRV